MNGPADSIGQLCDASLSQQGSSESTTESGSVRGERGASTVNGARSLQSRVSSFLAAGLMIALGVGGLSWYYANALGRQSHARQAAANAVTNSAQGEMALPPLGAVAPPRVLSSAAPLPRSDVASSADADSGTRSRQTSEGFPATSLNPDAVVRGSVSWAGAGNWGGAGSTLMPYAGPGSSAPVQRPVPQDRRLSGTAFARDSLQAGSSVSDSLGSGAPVPSVLGGTQGGGVALLEASRGSSGQTSSGRSEDGLAALLRPISTSPARALALPTQQFLLPKGAFIDCTLETAIDSTLPGMVTCVTATDTFGVDGKVVLLERGSKLVGETRGEVQNGAARVFVLWTEARTPTGVLVPLDSPGTDELGRSGLPGEVNRHFWDRFGAALLVSVIDGAMQAAAQSTSRNGAIIYNPGSSADALTDILKGTIQIAPTVTKHQGDRIQILVARDLDFRSVYELRAAGR